MKTEHEPDTSWFVFVQDSVHVKCEFSGEKR